MFYFISTIFAVLIANVLSFVALWQLVDRGFFDE